MAHVGVGFHPRFARTVKGFGVARINVSSDVKGIAVVPLNAEHHHSAIPLRHLLRQLVEVLGPARRYRVRELGEAIGAA